MEHYQFTDEYKTQIDSIDYEHSKLIDYINAIIDTEGKEENRLLLEINLDELIGYTVFHFKSEEEMMLKVGYPGYEEHKKVHDALKTAVTNFKVRFDNNEDIFEELTVFLGQWLLKHIKGKDMDYAPLFKEKGIE